MKKIINKPETLVREMCHGIVMAHSDLALDSKNKVIYRKNLNPNKVSLISGGGSGHEPAHSGFVGKGLLDAAVCGDIFASPSQIQVYQAIKRVSNDRGILLIIKNYSGDIMNFKNAGLLAQEDGMKVDYVKVDDDIAVTDSLYTVGRRGVAGTVFVHKIAGAAAEQGKTLAEVKAVAEKVIMNVKSIGFALSSCTVPAKGNAIFELGENEMEYGVGIHGEPGIKRISILSEDELASQMVASLVKELFDLNKSNTRKRVAVLVNGFGSTPLMELYALNSALSRELYHYDIEIARTFVGNYMTSLDMAGASISLLKLDDELESLLDEPCDAAALSVYGPVETVSYYDAFSVDDNEVSVSFEIETPDKFAKISDDKLTLDNLQYIVDVMSASIIRNEVSFCELDSHAGDGDFGMSLAKGFRQLKKEWRDIIAQPDVDIATFLHECAMIIMEHCGGASGPIWGSAFRSAGRAASGKKSLTVSDFAELLCAAVAGIQMTGERSFGRGAAEGDKTLIDALLPCAEAWVEYAKEGHRFDKAFKIGAEAAVKGAEKTRMIVARMGRAGTVGERSLGHPDAGAYALGVLFTDISKAVMRAD